MCFVCVMLDLSAAFDTINPASQYIFMANLEQLVKVPAALSSGANYEGIGSNIDITKLIFIPHWVLTQEGNLTIGHVRPSVRPCV